MVRLTPDRRTLLSYKQTEKEVSLITDRLGRPIDKGIRQAVTVFRYIGLSTSGSCHGHLSRALAYPWIEFNVDSQEENKRCRLIVEYLLNQYRDNEYLYLWNMGIFSGFRIETEKATSIAHLISLRQEMNKFVDFSCSIGEAPGYFGRE